MNTSCASAVESLKKMSNTPEALAENRIIEMCVRVIEAHSESLDAARWRWLRQQGGWPDSEASVSGFTPDQFDAMADAAIKKAK